MSLSVKSDPPPLRWRGERAMVFTGRGGLTTSLSSSDGVAEWHSQLKIDFSNWRSTRVLSYFVVHVHVYMYTS